MGRVAFPAEAFVGFPLSTDFAVMSLGLSPSYTHHLPDRSTIAHIASAVERWSTAEQPLRKANGTTADQFITFVTFAHKLS